MLVQSSVLYINFSPSFTDQPHSAPFSSENEAQGGNPTVWQCTPPPSTSPSGDAAAHPVPYQPASRPRSRSTSQSPSPPSALTGTKKRSSKPSHMRRNIRYCPQHPGRSWNLLFLLFIPYNNMLFTVNKNIHNSFH